MRHVLAIAIALAGVVLGAPDRAGADAVPGASLTESRVFTAPTAWLTPEGAITGSAGLDASSLVRPDHHGDGHLIVGYGLGGLAAVELGIDTDVRACAGCDVQPDQRPVAIWLARAAFRLGAPQDAWVRGMPAVALGVRTTAGSGNTRAGALSFPEPRVSEAYIDASRALGPVRLHAGAIAIAPGFGDRTLRPQVRPLGGLEWTPAQYPRTSLMGDFSYSARLETAAPVTEWVAGWGVRYQALRWASIELAVRHRDDEALRDSTVLLRVNGIWHTGD